jgi:hypothetical protein
MVEKMTTIVSKNDILAFIKKHKKRVTLVGVILVFFVAIGGGIALQQMRLSDKESQTEGMSKTADLRPQQKKESIEPKGKTPESTPFLLKPSPDELLQQLTSLENYNEDVVGAKYIGLRVLWPVYFFTLQATTGSKATLVLDVAEDGFGVVIECEVDTSTFPQLRDLEQGKKIWIGGEILSVDRSGTGTVYLKTEHLKIGDDSGFPANRTTAN